MSLGPRLESFMSMAERTSTLLRVQHDLHIVQTICDQLAHCILAFEIPAGRLLYVNAAAKAHLESLYPALLADLPTEPLRLVQLLPADTWQAWLKDAEIADHTGDTVHSGKSTQLLNAQTIPIYPRVVARCIMRSVDTLPDGAALGKTICPDDQA